MLSQAKCWQIQYAAHVMRQGGVIAYPTETVWGLGCDPNNAAAVNRLLEIKRRPAEKGLILISGWQRDFDFLLKSLDDSLKTRFLEPTPEPTTWLVPDPKDQVPVNVKGRFSAVAVRLTQFSIVAELSRCFGGPIVSTSANRAGEATAGSPFRLQQIFGNELDYVLPALLGGHQKPSTIRDLVTDQVIRA